ncbi:MAG: pyridoxamine 5'-phosphate oxidase [Bryobacterales bacterium]|nr:pyridoxamine 5'-phosphate oxidase [Bryobacterales bacterium]
MNGDAHDAVARARISYEQGELDERLLSADPMAQFGLWMQAAVDAGLQEPNAMTLATVGQDGSPSARMVLLRGFGADGFRFFTNYESAKGSELAAGGKAALVFYWAELERQVRVTGRVEKLAREENEAYFASRPRGHRLGAWASRQSEVVGSRELLEAALRNAEERFPGHVPLPAYWGGYRVMPQAVEFWQGRPDRLHDRIRYRRAGSEWVRERLSP